METTKYKLNTVWSIQKETIMNLKDGQTISSDKYDTTLQNVQYSIELTYCDIGKMCFIGLIYYDTRYPVDDDNYLENDNLSTKEMNLFITSANFHGDLGPNFRVAGVPAIGVNISRKELINPQNKYFVDDILKLEVRGILSYRKFEFNPGNVRWEKNDKDFKFIVGNRSIMAHKYELHGISPIFDAAMNFGEIMINDFRFSIVQDAIKLCYGCNNFEYKYYDITGTIHYRNDDLFDLIKFTNVYQMPQIKEHLENEFVEIVNAKNVCELANKSLELKAEILRTFCVNFLSNCIKNGTPFNGTLANLKPEIALLVFKSSFCHSQTS